jgi:opacity protein-like surface antigen
MICQDRHDWSAQFVTRFGSALGDGRMLPYVLGGVALSHLSFNRQIASNVVETWSASNQLSGVVLGGGLQYGLGPNVSVGAEYLHTSYGTQDFSTRETVTLPGVGVINTHPRPGYQSLR